MPEARRAQKERARLAFCAGLTPKKKTEKKSRVGNRNATLERENQLPLFFIFQYVPTLTWP
jgi:hypothetical protein